MVLWLNGAFGVGKTTVAQAICRAVPGAFLFDPEEVGAFLWDHFPPSMSRLGDFQDLPLWRSISGGILAYLEEQYQGPLVVPMTVTRPEYWEQITGRMRQEGRQVLHFVLLAPAEVLKQRLRARGEPPHSWPEQQIDRCIQAFSGQITGYPIATEGRSAQQVAGRILLQAGLCAGPEPSQTGEENR